MGERKLVVIQVFLLIVASSRAYAFQESTSTDSTPDGNNCSTTDSFLILRPPNEARENEMDTIAADVLVDTRNKLNVSRPRTLTSPKDWDEKPKLKFPKFATEERYKMASLHLDKGWFTFDFLRGFLSFVQPYDLPVDLLTDIVERRISIAKLVSESMHVEAAFLGLVGVCCVLACIIPGTELWLACRPIREDYKPSRRPGVLAFLLSVLAFILGSCMATMIICNEAVTMGIGKIPMTLETALQDLREYHADTTSQLRKYLTRSLDVASEAILADLDNVEELLGKPVQTELSVETGLDVALDALVDLANVIRREINAARARIVDQTRNVETSSFELSKQLDSARNVADYAVPHVIAFEHIRWIVGIATVLCILLVFSLLIGALCCHCGSSENKVRPTLLCGVVASCFVSIALWAVFIVALGIASHTEMLICRPLEDPDYRAMEAVLETRAFLGRRLTVPLKDLFEKCRNNDAAYPAFGLENVMKLEQMTAHWTWPGLSRAISNIKIDLKGLHILTPNLRHRLQDLMYACSLNLTAHRITIQGPILSKDLNTMSDQLDNISRQLQDRSIARELHNIGITMRDLSSRRVRPLMKLQDDLVYRLAILELQVQPLWRQINQSIFHLRTIQYYIDHQGDKIAQLKTKLYNDRLTGYLDQWRTHVLTEMGMGVSKCRPLWDVLEGLRNLLCAHILGPFDGFWFATLMCAVALIVSTPTAHVLSLVYKKSSYFKKDAVLLPRRSASVTTEQEAWQTPEPPPPPSNW